MSTVAIAAHPHAGTPARSEHRASFVLKAALAVGLAAVADHLFLEGSVGSTLGMFALLLLAATVLVHRAVRRSRGARTAAAAALLFALLLVDQPSLLAWTLFWGAATSAALLPRATLDDGRRWAVRLVWQGGATLALPFRDAAKLRAARRRGARRTLGDRLPVLALPLIGSLVFIALFARANPLIGDMLTEVRHLFRFEGASPLRASTWLLAFFLAWSMFRPSTLRLAAASDRAGPAALPGVTLASTTLSLLAFNAIFALQNGLDIAFLWSGAPLPEGMTLAQYAHRGAYPLIVTALLAGLFVLLTLRPGSPMAASGRLRRLVYLWVAQNVLLVASTMLRTFDYVEAFSLTRLRIAALIWMALVAVGLVLICYRIWRGRSGAWLVNANCAAALTVLTGCAAVDLGETAAAWNVRHTREAGGTGAALDLCYLVQLGDSALLPLIDLESGRIGPVLRDRVAWGRHVLHADLEAKQADWRTWTVRGARRLALVRERIAAGRLPSVDPEGRGCNGIRLYDPALPPEPVAPPGGAGFIPVPSAPPLTPAPAR
jgi:hypothetical protein